MTEVAPQGVAVDDDAVGDLVAVRAVAVVQAVGPAAPTTVGDHDRDVLEGVAQQVGQLVERVAHELLEVVVVERVERHEVQLGGLGGDAVAGQALRAAHEALELRLVGGLAPVGHAAHHQRHDGAEHDRAEGEDRNAFQQPHRERGRHPLGEGDRHETDAQGDAGGEGGAAQGGHRAQPAIARAITTRWISFVPS